MKKLFDSKFLFIVALSLVVLIVLGVGAFYLFDDADDVFVKNGYVLNPLSSKVEKYFFNEDATYKENLSSMVVFKDVDNNEVSILKDSFLHYNDGSLSFLKNGAILDLDTVDGTEAVNFYNISSKSIIEKDKTGYVISSRDKNIKLKNFIGRINDNKYIVVGNLEAKIPGNEKNISGDYFEIVYTDEGVVNIENKDIKFQVTADGTFIYVGSKIVIDLGAKKISLDGEDIMSITAITINGDENIEIIPKTEEKKDEEDNGDAGNDSGDGNGSGGGVDGDGNGGTGMENIDAEITEDIIVSLKNAVVGSTSVDVTFDIYNQKADDTFSLKVTNLDSGRTVDIVNNIVSDEEIRISLLSPNTKYLFTVTNDIDSNKYFQKIFETSDFGIKLEKMYATDSELGFKVTVDEGTDITNAKLSLYKFNEETNQNEIVTVGYYDNTLDEIVYREKVTYLSSMESNIEGVHEIIYDGLDSNTIYTAVLDEFSLVSVNFKDVYNITLTSMTLKKTPVFKDMTVDKNVGTGTFKLSLGDIQDEDNAIESYTYVIYDVNNPEEPAIDPITKTNASPIEVKVGDGENELKNDTNYFYKVIILYYDNEKYVEYIIDDTINFVMGSDPYITVVPNNNKISYDRIAATIYLTDNSCLIAMPGREKCTGASTTRVIVTSSDGDRAFDKIVEFEVTDDEIKYDLDIGNLQSGTTYTVEVEAVRSDKYDEGPLPILHTEESRKNITTKTLSNFIADWVDKGSNATHVVNLQTKFIADIGTGTLSPEESADSIQKVVVKLYNGSYVENLQSQAPIAIKSFVNTDEFNIKEKFYDNSFNITTDEIFGLDIDGLKEKNDGRLSEYYTLAIYAYYDDNSINEVKLANNVTSYKISPILLMENISEPEIYVDPITKRASGIENNLINPGTVVGFSVMARFDSAGLLANNMHPKAINLYVYNDSNEKVSFYVKNGNSFELVESIQGAELTAGSDFYEQEIFMANGSDYYTIDEVMSRGNSYYVGYELIVESANERLLYPSNTNKNVEAPFGKYTDKAVVTEKETPTITMYVAKSTADSITYRYSVKDPDNAFYREADDNSYGFYYTINDSEENKINITSVETNEVGYNTFAGDLTINGLSSGDEYYLYYKKNVTKTGDFEVDVLNYFDSGDAGRRIFDGYYDALLEEYNFKYEVINNPLYDNKVTIKILASNDMLSRILDYKITFKDSKNNVLTKEMWNLESCGDDEETPRCFTVDYVELKNAGMKSSNDEENLITVFVEAYYDNGLSGYDYTVGENKEFQYMIFQNNLIPDTEANYISFTKSGSVSAWSDLLGLSKGYYLYVKGTGYINYYYLSPKSRPSRITISLTSSGYMSNNGVLNPKMVSVESMTSDKKTFSFNSITPKISVKKPVSLINGGVVNVSLSGADLNDFCEGGHEGEPCINNSNSEFYLYIDVWKEKDYIGDRNLVYRPTVSVKINKNNATEELQAVVDKLPYGSKYYYNVYAYLNKNGNSEYTQLFDISFSDKYATKTYEFNSLSSIDLFRTFESIYKPNPDGDYNDKILVTKVNLLNYANNIPFNFDLGYALCNIDDFLTCGVQDDSDNIFRRIISQTDVKTDNVDTVNVSEYDLVANKKYYNYIYAIFDAYDFNGALRKTYLQINRSNMVVNLDALKTPEFVIDREAGYADGEYLFDFTVNVNDPSKVLNSGKYYVRLRDMEGNIVGNVRVKDDDGNYITVATNGEYYNYSFDASVANKSIRITGLEPDTKYTIEAYGEAYINNADGSGNVLPEDDRTVNISKVHTIYTVNTSGVAFGKDLLFSATEKSIVVTFLGGSKFDNVQEVGYTVGLWDDNQSSSNATYSGTYIIGENNKRFEMFKDTGDWKFVIDDSRMNNVLGQTYTVALSFKVLNTNPDTGLVEEFYYDSISNPEFAGKAQYVKDNGK